MTVSCQGWAILTASRDHGGASWTRRQSIKGRLPRVAPRRTMAWALALSHAGTQAFHDPLNGVVSGDPFAPPATSALK